MIAGLVLGIISVAFCWVPGVFITGIVGLVCSVSGRKKALLENKPSGLGIAGLIISIIGIVFGFIGTICTIITCAVVGITAASSPSWLNIFN